MKARINNILYKQASLLKIVALLFLLPYLFSCGKSAQEVQADVNDSIERITVLRDSIDSIKVLAMKTKYNALMDWDTLRYTYDLQRLFVQEKRIMQFNGKITDFISRDSCYYLELKDSHSHFNNQYISILKIDKRAFDIIRRDLMEEKTSKQITVFIEVSSILSTSAFFKPNYYDENVDEESGHITAELSIDYDFNGKLRIIKGKLVDFITYDF
jgi:hypothetical protein